MQQALLKISKWTHTFFDRFCVDDVDGLLMISLNIEFNGVIKVAIVGLKDRLKIFIANWWLFDFGYLFICRFLK